MLIGGQPGSGRRSAFQGLVTVLINDLGNQAQFPCPGDGLGAVGRAEFVQDVAAPGEPPR